MRRIRLITVDVTGTIFKFREPPSRVYKRFASDSGLECSHEALQDSLALNMRKMSKNYPNFGASGIGSYQWWKRVVHLTFQGKPFQQYLLGVLMYFLQMRAVAIILNKKSKNLLQSCTTTTKSQPPTLSIPTSFLLQSQTTKRQKWLQLVILITVYMSS